MLGYDLRGRSPSENRQCLVVPPCPAALMSPPTRKKSAPPLCATCLPPPGCTACPDESPGWVSPQRWCVVNCSRATPPGCRTFCPIEGHSVPHIPALARTLTRCVMGRSYIAGLTGPISANTCHWHRPCSAPGIVDACAYRACQMMAELRIRPGLRGEITLCCVSTLTVEAARA
jgi:hypothetical protein